MKLWTGAALVICMAAMGSAASADPDKDESGKGRLRGGYEREYRGSGRYFREERDYGRRDTSQRRAFKEEYDDGRCKVERKLEKNGEYKEERKCRSSGYGYRYR